jgi:hypothetical protein
VRIDLGKLRDAGDFTCSQLARASGVSRQAALKYLNRARRLGLVERVNSGRGTRYALRASPIQPEYGAGFWRVLESKIADFRYVSVRDACGPRCQATDALTRCIPIWEAVHLVLDFEGVVSVTLPCAVAFATLSRRSCSTIKAINARPEIAGVLAQAQAIEAQKARPD